MTKIILNGCGGKMGRTIEDMVSRDDSVTIVAGVDLYSDKECYYPVFKTISECNIKADVVVDFSVVVAVPALLEYCVSTGTPCVLCTTGLDETMLEMVRKASEKVAILKSANMSLGVNLLIKLLKEASGILSDAGFDVDIVEKHHRLKVDAPSGTALALADAVRGEIGQEYEYVFDRSQRRVARPVTEIGISAVRGGTIVGEHDVIFAGDDEVITFTHTAYSKAIFAKGSLQAAKYLKGKTPGWYEMSDVVLGS